MTPTTGADGVLQFRLPTTSSENRMDETDLQSHHIEGYAQAALDAGRSDAYFSLPLISHIEGNLWMGGCREGEPLDDFVHVISLYPWERYEIGRETCRAEFQLYDTDHMPTKASLFRIRDYVNGCLKEGKTLVHCQAGLNRSGLVSAMSLISRGMDADVAIALLRKNRSSLVLCNATFEKWLMEEV